MKCFAIGVWYGNNEDVYKRQGCWCRETAKSSPMPLPSSSTSVSYTHLFSAYLLPEENEDPKFRAIAWQSLLWAIWGQASENGGSKATKSAPKELKEKYQQVFA